MWIESEPGEFPMMRYMFCFARDTADPEDAYVRAFLREHNLAPRRTWTEERHGIACEVLQFGQCYLAGALHAVDALRTRGMVAEALGEALVQDEELAALLPPHPADERPRLLWQVAGALLARNALGATPEAPDRTVVDTDALREELQRAGTGTGAP